MCIRDSAREAWADTSTNVRASSQLSRSDKGRQRTKPDGELATEKDWIKRIRESVVQVINQPHDDLPSGDASDMWGDAHEQEASFNRNKQTLHTVQAFEDGVLLMSEVGPLLQEHQMLRAKNVLGR